MPRIRIAHNYTRAEANSVYDELIHNYFYKPSPIISYRNRENRNALTFGLEVEAEMKPSEYSIEAIASAARCVMDIADGRVYLKRDGSVTSGFEIVSHPATLASHMYDAHWTGILNKCTKHGLRSHDAKTWGGSCGLHIHVGRAQLGSTDVERNDVIRKVKVLVYRHWNEIVTFTRRSRSQLDQWAAREISDLNLAYIVRSPGSGAVAASCLPVTNSHGNRYIAVNCENSATIEFRLFNGTLKRDTLMASIQLCNSICKYAISHTWEEIVASNFLEVALFERYNELETYLIARGLMSYSDMDGRAQNTNRIPRHNGADGVEG